MPGSGTLLLVGQGKMGGAMLDGWLAAGSVTRVAVVEPLTQVTDPGNPRLAIYTDAQSLPADFNPETVVLAVKPQVMAQVVPFYARFVGPNTVFLSIAAGKSLNFFRQYLGDGAAVVRAMPNTPAAIRRGITVACANAAVTADQAQRCETLLAAVGEVGWVSDEALIDAVTAVSGSGPAYVFLLIEALAAAGVAAGLPADLAMGLARTTISGSGELARLSAESAEQLRRNVTSPGGTTEAALRVLMAEDGLVGLMTRAVAAATVRSRELANH
ncbi:Pyrroline-5-carboxylate reductase [uncultured Gammaproteobacteria bacterium]